MRPGAAASCRGAPSSRVRRPPAARAAPPAECPCALPPEAVPAFPASASGHAGSTSSNAGSGKDRMLNEEDQVHAAIPPGRTAGRTAARTAVAAADLHRPVPRRQGTRGARRGARPACRAAAGPPAAAARSKSADHLPPPRHLLPGTAGPEGANRHVCPVTGPAGTRSLSPAHTLCPGPARHQPAPALTLS
jgi:hypothetical protein